MPSNEADREVDRNVAVHNRIALQYEKIHGEIFNAMEQQRLWSLLGRAAAEVRTGNKPIEALDMGCGSGNLTRHLLALGAQVTAADVAPGFLDLVTSRYGGERLKTHRLNGHDLGELADRSFDLVATYSVLHHIPDYLAACSEMARVCRTGGVVVIDHEASPNVWKGDAELERFRRKATRFDWRKYTRPANYAHRLRRLFNRRYSAEGDIHVWADDHIEWGSITEVMHRSGCEPVLEENYLLYRGNYWPNIYADFADHCVDTRAMVFRRR